MGYWRQHIPMWTTRDAKSYRDLSEELYTHPACIAKEIQSKLVNQKINFTGTVTGGMGVSNGRGKWLSHRPFLCSFSFFLYKQQALQNSQNEVTMWRIATTHTANPPLGIVYRIYIRCWLIGRTFVYYTGKLLCHLGEQWYVPLNPTVTSARVERRGGAGLLYTVAIQVSTMLLSQIESATLRLPKCHPSLYGVFM